MGSGKPARRPAGPASGVLGGRYPAPGWGLPMGGQSYADDFVGAILKGSMQTQLAWLVNDIAGGVVIAAGTETATERGVLQMVTAGALGDGGVVEMSSSYGGAITGGPPVGMMWGAKVRAGVGGADAVRAWSGWSDTAGGDWLVVGGVNAIGIRAIVAGGSTAHWFGVVKDGAGAANEVTVDLGVDYNETWRFFGFIVTATGIQFVRWDASQMPLYGLLYEPIDDEVTTHIPTGTLYPVALGIDAATAAQRRVEIDWWGTGGAIAR